jgi:serine/threonine protein kinase
MLGDDAMSQPPERTPTSEAGREATAVAVPSPRSERPERKPDRASMRPGGPESLVGTTLSGRYLIERLIGEGGMGAVYQAEHTHMRKRLAVKVLHPEMSRLPEVVARFEREAMAAAHIEHPNVAAATDFGKLEDGSFFLVLEYVEGRSLRDAIAEGRLELGRALHVGRQIASALGRAHALGIVHRDLKPENVMLVARDGDPDFAKVLDFGIAKVPVGELVGEAKVGGQVLTQLGMVYGTPEYMAPEQALGQPVDARADLYALGVILFEMLAGVRPYEHESKVTLLGMHVTAPIPKMSARAPGTDVPPEVEALVAKLLAKEASARHADAKELTDAIDDLSMRLAAEGRIVDPIQPMSRG